MAPPVPSTPEPAANPHAGRPFVDDDATLARYLNEVSVPALMCSLAHITGDPAWIRGDIRPRGAWLNEYQGFLDDGTRAEAVRRALPVVADHRDRGCPPPVPLPPGLVTEMMAYLACGPVPDEAVEMFVEDLHLDGADSGRVEWGEAIDPEVRKRYPVVVVGAGEAGILAGIRLSQAGLPFVIFDRNPGPGGTWWENRYPGARVDVGSHFYCYSFRPADHWSEYFARQPELQRYFADVVAEYGLGPHIRFRHEVTGATWDEATARWRVRVVGPDGTAETHEAAVLISAVGSLNIPNLPDIAGRDDFAGPAFHSARWDHGVELEGARVAMIGAGASGFQIAPTIAPLVEHLTVFQRTAQWMFPNPLYRRQVPDGQRWAIRHLPFYGRWFRFLTFWPGSGISIDAARIDPAYDDGGLAVSERNRQTREFFLGWIRDEVGDDPELLAAVTPDYPATGKRTLQDDGSWLRCLRREDVALIRTPIERIVADGVVDTDGRHHRADVLVFATGFRHNDYLWPLRIVGRDGRDLREMWGHEPAALYGMTVPGFPNLFCLYGPGTNLAHGSSLIFQSECQVRYVMDALRHLIVGGYRALEPRPEVYDEYRRRYADEISQMVWSHPAVRHSHYKNPEGRIWTLSPWPVSTYWRWTRAVDPGEYLVR